MARSDRIAVTVSPEMSIALDVLGARSGLSRSAQAMVVLRQGLARTIETRTVQERVRERRAHRTMKDWQQDTTTEHAVDLALAAFDEGAILREIETANEAAHGRSGAGRTTDAENRSAGALYPVAHEGMAQRKGGDC